MKGDAVELGLICSLVRKMKIGISSQEGLRLMTRVNGFLRKATREEIVTSISGAEIPKVVQVEKPTPLY